MDEDEQIALIARLQDWNRVAQDLRMRLDWAEGELNALLTDAIDDAEQDKEIRQFRKLVRDLGQDVDELNALIAAEHRRAAAETGAVDVSEAEGSADMAARPDPVQTEIISFRPEDGEGGVIVLGPGGEGGRTYVLDPTDDRPADFNVNNQAEARLRRIRASRDETQREEGMVLRPEDPDPGFPEEDGEGNPIYDPGATQAFIADTSHGQEGIHVTNYDMGVAEEGGHVVGGRPETFIRGEPDRSYTAADINQVSDIWAESAPDRRADRAMIRGREEEFMAPLEAMAEDPIGFLVNQTAIMQLIQAPEAGREMAELLQNLQSPDATVRGRALGRLQMMGAMEAWSAAAGRGLSRGGPRGRRPWRGGDAASGLGLPISRADGTVAARQIQRVIAQAEEAADARAPARAADGAAEAEAGAGGGGRRRGGGAGEGEGGGSGRRGEEGAEDRMVRPEDMHSAREEILARRAEGPSPEAEARRYREGWEAEEAANARRAEVDAELGRTHRDVVEEDLADPERRRERDREERAEDAAELEELLRDDDGTLGDLTPEERRLLQDVRRRFPVRAGDIYDQVYTGGRVREYLLSAAERLGDGPVNVQKLLNLSMDLLAIEIRRDAEARAAAAARRAEAEPDAAPSPARRSDAPAEAETPDAPAQPARDAAETPDAVYVDPSHMAEAHRQVTEGREAGPSAAERRRQARERAEMEERVATAGQGATPLERPDLEAAATRERARAEAEEARRREVEEAPERADDSAPPQPPEVRVGPVDDPDPPARSRRETEAEEAEYELEDEAAHGRTNRHRRDD